MGCSRLARITGSSMHPQLTHRDMRLASSPKSHKSHTVSTTTSPPQRLHAIQDLLLDYLLAIRSMPRRMGILDLFRYRCDLPARPSQDDLEQLRCHIS